MTKADLDMIEHFDNKCTEISRNVSRKLNIFITAAMFILLASFSVIIINTRIISGMEADIDVIHGSYVPGTLLWDFSNAIDRELESLYQLENGNTDTALYIVEKFATYRKELYEIHMRKSRGDLEIELKSLGE
jgi:hypothetical protein